MKLNKNFVIFAACALALAAGCKSQYEELLQSNNVQAKYDAAFEYFNSGKYSKAAQLFESLAMFTQGTEKDDTVNFYWALSNYNMRDYYSAESNLEHFLANYPASPFNEPAQFLRIDCLYRGTLRYELDQTPTYKAITAINEYKLSHLNSPNIAICDRMLEDLEERLDRKAFESAKLYYKMEDYKASRVALKNVLKEDANNIYREDILYYSAMSSYKYAYLSVAQKQKERYMVFIDDYLNFIEEFPESHYRKELDGLYAKVKKL
ncbi:MAG: outer membrane protein assembly factor BamD [Candidatus Cryptobacteroides sp.]